MYEESKWSWARWLAEGSTPSTATVPEEPKTTSAGSLDDRMPNPKGGDQDTPYVQYAEYHLSIRQTISLVRLRLLIEDGHYADDMGVDEHGRKEQSHPTDDGTMAA